MEVRLFPNVRRPGIGLKPRRESQRPLLPQHGRHCPVLEAGSSLGFMIYPPLEPHESFYVGYEGEGRYRFGYFLKTASGSWQGIFSVELVFPVGGIGMFKENVTFLPDAPDISRDLALHIAHSCFVPNDANTPAGAVTLRGAWNFQTPPGWDTVYTSVLNSIERPVAPMLVVRVETDWYAHESELRYVLLPGEGMSVVHSMPIGQAFFVPREAITLRDCSESEIADIRTSQSHFSRDKKSVELTTAYGLTYSPHYSRQSHQQNNKPGVAGGAVPLDAAGMKAGRNDPCPCGSGAKFKKCHGRLS